MDKDTFIELADPDIVIQVWESDIMEELTFPEFVEHYQVLHRQKYGYELDLNVEL